jgi:hypothetical protein
MRTTRVRAITDSMRDSIEIKHFIYHILDTDEDEVDFLSEVTLDSDQKDFFKEMIADSSKGTRYLFTDIESYSTCLQAKSTLDNYDDRAVFINASKLIATNFRTQHDRRMTNGIFVMSTFSMLVDSVRKNFVAILKIDYKPVYQQVRNSQDRSKVTFQEIRESLSQEKASIKNKALIDFSDTFAWDVMALERGKSTFDQDTDSAVGVHFKTFLHVRLMESNSTLTKNALSQVKAWAETEEHVDATDAKSRAISFITANADVSITMDDIKEVVCIHHVAEIKDSLEASFDSHMESVELNGVQFVAKSGSITDKDRKNKIRTNHGVTIEWQGLKNNSGIKVSTVAGKQVITITAENIDEFNQ